MIRSQNLIPLTSGAYKTRDAIGSYLIGENCFLEMNPEDVDPSAPTSVYSREGLKALSSPPTAGLGRGLFVTSNGALYAAVGNAFYAITSTFQWQFLGNIPPLSTPVSVDDNGTTALIVDGSPQGHTVTLKTDTFAILDDPTGTYVGATRVSFSDTYLAMNAINSNEWMVTDPNTVTFEQLQQANADITPGNLVTLQFNIRQMWLLKSTHTELWFLAGSTPFPYQAWPNILIPYGCDAAYSLTQADVDLFWISRNNQGHAIAVKTNGDSVVAISTRALEYEWSNYETCADCIGSTYQIAGHTFIRFTFPTANKTWVYDLASKQWYQSIWIDTNGVQHRERCSFYASVGAYGNYPETIVGQDWQTGQIYSVSPRNFSDNGTPIVCRRTFPHQMMDMKELTLPAFVADFATGEIIGGQQTGTQVTPIYDFNSDFNTDFSTQQNPTSYDKVTSTGTVGLSETGTTPNRGSSFNNDYNLDFTGVNGKWNLNVPALCMRYSKNGGQTWSNYRQKRLLTSGHYRSMMRFRGLGMGRDWIFELLWVYPGPTALNGAYADPPLVHGS